MSATPDVIEPGGPMAQPPVDHLLFEQYKLAVEMADGISTRRQTANNFYIGLVSGLSTLYAFIEKALPSSTWSIWVQCLLFLPVFVCGLWGLTIYSYRRINIAKWDVIYDLEKKLPDAPFKSEGDKLGSKSFTLTKVELVIPLLMGLFFLILAIVALCGGRTGAH